MSLRQLLEHQARPAPHPAQDPLDDTLIPLSSNDRLTVRAACEGVMILGSTGAGKTSGSGRALADGLLRRGFGGVVLCVKPGDAAEWVGRVKAVGRERDLVLFGPDHPATFNPLQREVDVAGPNGDPTEQVVSIIGELGELSDPGSAKGHEDSFFRAASRDCLRNVIALMILARVRLTLDAIYEVIATAPTDLKTAARPDLMKDRPVGQLLALMEARLTPENVPRAQRVRDYWLVRFPGYPDKTRAGVIEGMMARVGALSSGSLGRLFGSDMTWTPDRVYGGAVTVVDCPQLKFGEAGRLATCLLKCSYTRDVQRRPVGPDTQPVFLWCDEVQYVITSSDVMYATTARSARSITVFLSQNVSTLTAMLGGDMGADAFVHSLLGNLRTKFFHSCEESRTCSYLADLVGYEFVPVPSWTVPTGDAGAGSPGPSATMGMQRIFRVEPSAVQGLKTGGPLNDYQVEALVFRGGQPFASGKNFLKATFDQRTGGVR